MGEDLNASIQIFRCETPYTRIFRCKKSVHYGLIFGCKNWYMYPWIFSTHVRINFRMQKLIHVPTDFSQKSIHVRITYVWEHLWMFTCLSTYVTIIRNFGAQHSFAAMAKYQHWLERADVTLMLRCYPSTLVRNGVILHVCTDLYRSHSD